MKNLSVSKTNKPHFNQQQSYLTDNKMQLNSYFYVLKSNYSVSLWKSVNDQCN